MTAQEWTTEAMEHLLNDGRVRRCWIQNKDLRKIRLAIYARESRTWWQAIGHAAVGVLGVFLP